MRTTLSEEEVARRGSVGWGVVCQERDMEGGVRVARGMSCIIVSFWEERLRMVDECGRKRTS